MNASYPDTAATLHPHHLSREQMTRLDADKYVSIPIQRHEIGDTRGDWPAARQDELDAGDIGAICAAGRAYPFTGVKKTGLDKARATSRPTHPACGTPGSGPAACSSAPVP